MGSLMKKFVRRLFMWAYPELRFPSPGTYARGGVLKPPNRDLLDDPEMQELLRRLNAAARKTSRYRR